MTPDLFEDAEATIATFIQILSFLLKMSSISHQNILTLLIMAPSVAPTNDALPESTSRPLNVRMVSCTRSKPTGWPHACAARTGDSEHEENKKNAREIISVHTKEPKYGGGAERGNHQCC